MHMITMALRDHVDWYQRRFFPIRSAFFHKRLAFVIAVQRFGTFIRALCVIA